MHNAYNVATDKEATIVAVSCHRCVRSMLVRGYRRDLTADDLLDLKPEDKCDEVVSRFEHEWKKELKETKWK